MPPGRVGEHERAGPAGPGRAGRRAHRRAVIVYHDPDRAAGRAEQTEAEVVAEAANRLDAVAQAARFRPSVVLMDIRMTELDGLEATRRILGAAVTERTRRPVLTGLAPLCYWPFELPGGRWQPCWTAAESKRTSRPAT